MIPDYFHEEPFPFNISSVDLSDFYISQKFISIEEAKEKFQSDDVGEIKEFYDDMVNQCISANFSDYYIAVIHNAFPIVHSSELEVSEILERFNVDLTHLIGNSPLDLQLIVVPFDDLDDAENFAEELRNYARIEYWGFGEKIGANQEWIVE